MQTPIMILVARSISSGAIDQASLHRASNCRVSRIKPSTASESFQVGAAGRWRRSCCSQRWAGDCSTTYRASQQEFARRPCIQGWKRADANRGRNLRREQQGLAALAANGRDVSRIVRHCRLLPSSSVKANHARRISALTNEGTDTSERFQAAGLSRPPRSAPHAARSGRPIVSGCFAQAAKDTSGSTDCCDELASRTLVSDVPPIVPMDPSFRISAQSRPETM